MKSSTSAGSVSDAKRVQRGPCFDSPIMMYIYACMHTQAWYTRRKQKQKFRDPVSREPFGVAGSWCLLRACALLLGDGDQRARADSADSRRRRGSNRMRKIAIVDAWSIREQFRKASRVHVWQAYQNDAWRDHILANRVTCDVKPIFL